MREPPHYGAMEMQIVSDVYDDWLSESWPGYSCVHFVLSKETTNLWKLTTIWKQVVSTVGSFCIVLYVRITWRKEIGEKSKCKVADSRNQQIKSEE